MVQARCIFDQALRQTGHGVAPERLYNMAARRSCSVSEAAAGSPLPPTDAHVPKSNWYLPR